MRKILGHGAKREAKPPSAAPMRFVTVQYLGCATIDVVTFGDGARLASATLSARQALVLGHELIGAAATASRREEE